MYESENINNIPVPQIQLYDSHLQKAFKYFNNQIDYNACGTNLRIGLEEFFRGFLPYKYFVNNEHNPVPKNNLMLDALLVKAREYFTYIGFDTAPIDKLERYRTRSLNPTAHFNPRNEYFKKELKEIFSIFDGLKKNINDPILEKDRKIKFGIRTQSGTSYVYTAILLDDIRLYKKGDGTHSYFKDSDERAYVMLGCTKDKVQTELLSHKINKCTLKTLYNDTIEYLNKSETVISEANIYEVFTDENGESLVSLKKY